MRVSGHTEFGVVYITNLPNTYSGDGNNRASGRSTDRGY
jgi:hypothetical protein